MYRQLKYLGMVLIMLLGLYPIAELTRVILVSGTYYFPGLKSQLIAEIIIMWTLYLSIAPVFLLFNNRNLRHFRKWRKEIQKQNSNPAVLNSLSKPKSDYIRVKYLD